MRRLLVPAALLVAFVSLLAMRPLSSEHAQPKRAARPPPAEVVAGTRPEEAAAPGPALPLEPAPAESAARVHGVVRGPSGILWLARVVAYRPQSGSVIADTYTDPEGKYSLDVAASDFDLAVEPDAGTLLAATPRRGLVVNAGDDIEEDFTIAPAASIRGKAVGRDGRACPGIVILALRPEDRGPDGAHPGAFLGREAGRCRSASDGTFRLAGFEAGTYAIEIGDPYWMLGAPAAVATDGPETTLVVVPAISVALEARDVESGEPVDDFSAKVLVGDRVVFQGEGAAGVFAHRAPTDPAATPFETRVEVTAPGFARWGPYPVAFWRNNMVAWLLPLRDPNATIRVAFDDGAPYRGGIQVFFAVKENARPASREEALLGMSAGMGRGSSVPFERVKDGIFRGAVPRGRWTLHVWPDAVLPLHQLESEVDVTGAGDADVRFVLPAGGTIVFPPPPRGAPTFVCIRGGADLSGGTRILVPPEGTRLEGVPPGDYQVGYPKTAKVNDEVSTHTIVWFQDVHVVVGGTEEIALPAE